MFSELRPSGDYRKNLKVSTLSFKAGRCVSEQWLSGPLQNYRYHINHLKLILCALLQVPTSLTSVA